MKKWEKIVVSLGESKIIEFCKSFDHARNCSLCKSIADVVNLDALQTLFNAHKLQIIIYRSQRSWSSSSMITTINHLLSHFFITKLEIANMFAEQTRSQSKHIVIAHAHHLESATTCCLRILCVCPIFALPIAAKISKSVKIWFSLILLICEAMTGEKVGQTHKILRQ